MGKDVMAFAMFVGNYGQPRAPNFYLTCTFAALNEVAAANEKLVIRKRSIVVCLSLLSG